jgi:murein DD-endopeptidase MepM/ murein hydrolase activator NlpD
MSTLPSSRSRSKLVLVALLLIVVAVLAAGGLYLRPRFESAPPQITLSPNADVLGSAPLEIRIADAGTGLKSVTATLSQGGSELNLVAEQFAQPAGEKNLAVALAKLAGVKEGPAVLRVTARDAALFRANEAVLEKSVVIDVTPPMLELVADDRYVNFGGVGVIVYKAAADTATSGVKIGGHFFPGFPGQVKDRPDHFLAFFAHPYDTPPEARPTLIATDRAGNTREMRLAYELKDVRYRKSTLPVSEGFVQNKVAPLVIDAGARQGALKDVFLAVNKRLRQENEVRIAAITGKATPKMLWDGAFVQLSNSKVEANFADHRTYTYNGDVIDTAYHLGYDLSVTKNYPVEAANGGTVAFTGDLGIYGNTVILDHGLGLFTLYSHLSAVDVKEGESVTKRQILGKTGETGLAAGDHLHYGVYLNGVAVLPVEWWDKKWIDDNVTPKLAGLSGQEIAQAQKPAKTVKAVKQGGGKKRQ